MKGNQTGVAVRVGEVEDGGGGGGRMPVWPEQPCQLERFSCLKRTTECVPLPGTKIN